MVNFTITISGQVSCMKMEAGFLVQSFLPKCVCWRMGDCSLGACLEEALGIGPYEEGKG